MSGSGQDAWKIRVRYSKQPPFTVDTLNASSLVRDLEKIIRHKASIPDSKTVQLHTGYPLQWLQYNETTTVGSICTNNSTITVALSEDASKSIKAGKERKKPQKKVAEPARTVELYEDEDDDDYDPTQQTKKQPRAFSLQDEPPPKRKKTSSAPKQPRQTKTPKNTQSEIPPEDLIGKLVQQEIDKRGVEDESVQQDILDKSKDTLAEIVTSIAEEGGESKTGQFSKLSQLMKTALQVEQETTLGISRLEAAMGGTFKMTNANVSKVGRNAPKFLKVSFSHGLGETVEDVVQEFSIFELKAILLFVVTTQGEEGKENLRPMRMASQSPRTFWSIVKHFGADVEAALKKLLPRVDWSFMSHRPRRQSSIAKSSESSKEIFAEAKKLYQRELKAKKDSEQKIIEMSAANGDNVANIDVEEEEKKGKEEKEEGKEKQETTDKEIEEETEAN